MPSPVRRQPANTHMKRRALVVVIGLLFVGLISAFYYRDDIHSLLAFGPGNWPTYEPGKDCKWVKTKFQKAGLTAYVDDCTNSNVMTFNDASGKVEGTWQGNTNVAFTIQVLSKDPSQSPRDIIEKYYARLTSDQRKACEIQNEDQPLEYYSSGALAGQPMNEADPHPTLHKTRLKIDLTKNFQNIIESNDALGDPKYNYLCGHDTGSPLESRPPYLEFDDRTPDKYLFVSSRGADDPPIDLNSLRF
jgi:hypothetical protein